MYYTTNVHVYVVQLINSNSNHCLFQDVLIRRWAQQRRLLARDVTRGIQYWRTASYSLLYILHFVSAVSP